MKEQILLKLSKADKDYLSACAKKERLPLSTYIRHKMLSEH
mgnify:CR=1 FL=1|jgi:hypothetical protein